jgi:hypothetical protein
MRDQLLMMADLQRSGYALDVRQLFGDDYDRILGLKDKLLRFKRAQRDVELLVETFNKRESVRIELSYRWRDLQAKRKQFEADCKSRVERLTCEAEDTNARIINRCINNVSILHERHTLCREVGRKRGVTPSNAG